MGVSSAPTDAPDSIATLVDHYLNYLAGESPYGPIHTDSLTNLLSVICSDKPGTRFGLNITADHFDGHKPRYLYLLEAAELAYTVTITYQRPRDEEAKEEGLQERFGLSIVTGSEDAVELIRGNGGWTYVRSNYPDVVADFMGVPDNQRQEQPNGDEYRATVGSMLDSGDLTEDEAALLTTYLDYIPCATPDGIEDAVEHARQRDTDIRSYAKTHEIPDVSTFLDEIHATRVEYLDWWV